MPSWASATSEPAGSAGLVSCSCGPHASAPPCKLHCLLRCSSASCRGFLSLLCCSQPRMLLRKGCGLRRRCLRRSRALPGCPHGCAGCRGVLPGVPGPQNGEQVAGRTDCLCDSARTMMMGTADLRCGWRLLLPLAGSITCVHQATHTPLYFLSPSGCQAQAAPSGSSAAVLGTVQQTGVSLCQTAHRAAGSPGSYVARLECDPPQAVQSANL